MADTDESQSDGNAAEAFEHLTEEVTVLHHTVEELVDAIQLKESPDYSSTLGKIAQDLGSIRERLEQIEHHPALRVPPAQFCEAVARAASGAMRSAANLAVLSRMASAVSPRLKCICAAGMSLTPGGRSIRSPAWYAPPHTH